MTLNYIIFDIYILISILLVPSFSVNSFYFDGDMASPLLRIATFNCRSFNNSLSEIQDLCKSHDIILLQETWLLPDDLHVLNSVNRDFLSFGTSAVDTTSVGFHAGRPYGGLAFLWRKDLGNAVSVKN